MPDRATTPPLGASKHYEAWVAYERLAEILYEEMGRLAPNDDPDWSELSEMDKHLYIASVGKLFLYPVMVRSALNLTEDCMIGGGSGGVE